MLPMCYKNTGLFSENFQPNRIVFAQIEVLMAKLSSYSSVICIVRFVMHNQLIIDEVKAVRASFKWVLYHKVDGSLIKFWKLVDMLAGVFAVWYAEPKIKVKGLQVLISKKVPFNHSEILDWSSSNTKLDSRPNCP